MRKVLPQRETELTGLVTYVEKYEELLIFKWCSIPLKVNYFRWVKDSSVVVSMVIHTRLQSQHMEAEAEDPEFKANLGNTTRLCFNKWLGLEVQL